MYCRHDGFALIELMIVVAIVGVLSAISITYYQDYGRAAQVRRAYAEISMYTAVVEDALARGKYALDNAELGFVQSNLMTPAADDVALINGDGSAVLRVVVGGGAAASIKGVVISLNRSAGGSWTCDVDESTASGWKESYMPVGCR